METEPIPPVTPEQARAALDDIAAVRRPVPVPWWYFGALAVLMIPIPAVTMLPSTVWGGLAAVGIGAVIAAGVGVVLGLYIRVIGMVPRVDRADRRRVWLPVGAVLALGGVAAWLDAGLDLWWSWFVFSTVVASLIIGYGVWHNLVVVPRQRR